MCRGAISVVAPAKINLYLGVYPELDESGYHRADSVMAALTLADRLVVRPAPTLSVEMSSALAVPPEENSVYRAACAMESAFGRRATFSIHVEKHIPLCAGLGGPSTDAAATIKALCFAWKIDLAHPDVRSVALSIGADVPFFLGCSPAYLSGRGDVFEESFELLDDLSFVVLKPLLQKGVSTAHAYRVFDSAPEPAAPLEPLLHALRAGKMSDAAGHIANNLAPAALCLMPEIGELICWLRAQEEVLVAEVCGSGAAVFAICASDVGAADVVARAHDELGVWAVRTKMEKRGIRPHLS